MPKSNTKPPPANSQLPKCPTGLSGLDEITAGGLPRGRPTLVCGSAGCGKTLMAIEFLVRGAVEYDEPGVFMAFEETAAELAQNVRSLGFDLDALADQQKLVVDYVYVERSEIEETGQYDLEGLFVRLGYAIELLFAPVEPVPNYRQLALGDCDRQTRNHCPRLAADGRAPVDERKRGRLCNRLDLHAEPPLPLKLHVNARPHPVDQRHEHTLQIIKRRRVHIVRAPLEQQP